MPIMIDLKKMRQYVVEQVENFDERMSVALARMGKYRESLERADYELYDDCYAVIEEYCVENNIKYLVDVEEVLDA
jgi:hypothetical protein